MKNSCVSGSCYTIVHILIAIFKIQISIRSLYKKNIVMVQLQNIKN